MPRMHGYRGPELPPRSPEPTIVVLPREPDDTPTNLPVAIVRRWNTQSMSVTRRARGR